MTKTVTLLKEIDEDLKTPQARVILQTLSDAAGVGVAFNYLELIELINANPNFISRQGANKVLRFYEKILTDEGYVLIEGSDKPPPVGKPERKLQSKTKDNEGKPTERKLSKRKKEPVGEDAGATA